MSRLLLDTHALLWWLTDDPALSTPARDALADPVNEPFVSAASVWEIAIKRSLGELTAPDDLPNRIAEQGFSGCLSTSRTPGSCVSFPRTIAIRLTACSLPRHSSRASPSSRPTTASATTASRSAGNRRRPHLERTQGAVITTGGGLALYPSSEYGVLSLAKAATRTASLLLSQELAPSGITVRTVTIAGTVAPGGPFDPSAIARTFLASLNQPDHEIVHTGEET